MSGREICSLSCIGCVANWQRQGSLTELSMKTQMWALSFQTLTEEKGKTNYNCCLAQRIPAQEPDNARKWENTTCKYAGPLVLLSDTKWSLLKHEIVGIFSITIELCQCVWVLACLQRESCLTCCQSIQCRLRAPPQQLNLWFSCWSRHFRSCVDGTAADSGTAWLWGWKPVSQSMSRDSDTPPTTPASHPIYNSTRETPDSHANVRAEFLCDQVNGIKRFF